MQTQSTSNPSDAAPAATVSRRRLLRASLLALPLIAVACSGLSASVPTVPAAAPTSPPTSTPAAVATAVPAVANVATTVTRVAATNVPASPTALPATSTPLAVTDTSVDSDEPTIAVTEGPYFKANSPERASLLDASVVGTPLTLTGTVVSTKGLPIAKALLDFWQADGKGSYDNSGYLLRGHQFTTAEGKYQLETVVPGLYPGRTRHIHVKVQAPNGPILTTQLFFPGEPQNASDSIFNAKLLVAETDGPNGSKLATFRFVVNTA
jgi:protocatechuate 3,4-dioxygenase beta subunit